MFYAFWLWTFLTCSAAFAAGTALSGNEIIRDCNSKGEIVRKKTVIGCHVTHAIIDGKRVSVE